MKHCPHDITGMPLVVTHRGALRRGSSECRSHRCRVCSQVWNLAGGLLTAYDAQSLEALWAGNVTAAGCADASNPTSFVVPIVAGGRVRYKTLACNRNKNPQCMCMHALRTPCCSWHITNIQQKPLGSAAMAQCLNIAVLATAGCSKQAIACEVAHPAPCPTRLMHVLRRCAMAAATEW